MTEAFVELLDDTLFEWSGATDAEACAVSPDGDSDTGDGCEVGKAVCSGVLFMKYNDDCDPSDVKRVVCCEGLIMGDCEDCDPSEVDGVICSEVSLVSGCDDFDMAEVGNTVCDSVVVDDNEVWDEIPLATELCEIINREEDAALGT